MIIHIECTYEVLSCLAAELLGVVTSDLCDALTTSGMVARGETITRKHSNREAVDVRDAVAKALYGRLFSWIVNKVNSLLAPEEKAGFVKPYLYDVIRGFPLVNKLKVVSPL